MHKQTDRQTDKTELTDYNNPLLSLSVKNIILVINKYIKIYCIIDCIWDKNGVCYLQDILQ